MAIKSGTPSAAQAKVQQRIKDRLAKSGGTADVYEQRVLGQTTNSVDTPVDSGNKIVKYGYDATGDEVVGNRRKNIDPIDDELFNEPESNSTVLEDTAEEMEETRTTRERAEAEYEGSYLDFADAYKRIHGTDAPWTTEQGFLDWRATQNKEDLDYLTTQQNIARELEASGAMKASEQMAGAEAATTAAMAQGREGAMSGTAPMFAQEFKQQMDRERNRIELERRSAENARQNAMTRLERAQEAGDVDLVGAIEGRISGIERDIQQQDQDALKLATLFNEQTMQAMELATAKSENTAESIFSMGTAASNLTYENLENMIANTDMTMPQALAVQQAAILMGEAAEAKDEADAAYKTAQATKLLEEAGTTTAIREWEFFSGLSGTEQTRYMELKRANPNMQYQELDDGSWVQFDPTGKTSPEIVYRPQDGDWSGVSGTSADALNVADGTDLGERGECGAFVNDYTGLGMGNTFDSEDDPNNKMSKTDPNLSSESAQAGDVFVMKYKGTGHCGFILSNNGDGTVTVKDSNFDLDHKVKTHDINISEITGLARGGASEGTPENGWEDKAVDFAKGIIEDTEGEEEVEEESGFVPLFVK